MNNLCEVSVICITYNQINYIHEALDSLINQKTNFSYELIIHDDCSNDGTAEVLKEYEKNNPHIIRLIYESENQWSKNIDFFSKIVRKVAKGKYIAFCEGDDYWIDVDKLQVQYEALESHPECDMCACRAKMVSADGTKELGEVRPKKQDGILSMEEVIAGGGNYVASAGLFFRRSMFEHMMDFEKIRSLDYSHQMKGALRGGIVYIDKTMAVYRRYSVGSVTQNITSKSNVMNMQCEQEKAILRKLDEETHGKYHRVIEDRIKDYDISCYEQLMQHKEEILKKIDSSIKNIYIWGMGVRGRDLEKFCHVVGIHISGICDIVDKDIGGTTEYGNNIVSSDKVLHGEDLVLASVNGAYDYLLENNKGTVINMQVYMPRI